MPIRKIEAGRIITVASEDWVGPEGTIWYDEELGDLRIGDGYTPGGRLLGTGGGGGQGPRGYAGSVGYTGSQGDAGSRGYAGSVGYTGSAGDVGYTGSAGNVGYTGSAGIDGIIGHDGYTGSRGDVGYTGSQGDIGLTGYTGSQGDTGYIGSRGDVGYTGSQGDVGYTGSQGDVGYTGSQGDVGYVGSQGDIGYTGSQGDVGYVGSQGDIGYTGSQGDVGYTGSQGEVGYVGSQGDIGYTGSKGDQGTPGTSVSIVGSTSTFALLADPYSGNIGDGFITSDNGHLNVWLGSAWQDVGQIIGYTGSQGDTGYTGSQGDIGYTGSAVIGLTTNAVDTVTLSTGFTFIPETNGLQDLGSATNRFGKIYLAGQTIDLGGTVISTGPDGDLEVKKPNGDLEKITVSSIKVGSTSTTSGVTITVDQYNNILFTSPNGTILNGYTGSVGYVGSKGDTGYVGSQGDVGYTGSQGDVGYTGSAGDVGYTGSAGDVGYTGSAGDVGYTGSQGDVGYTGSQGDVGYTGSAGPGADQDLNTTSTVTFASIILGLDGFITFPNGATQSGRAPRMVVDDDFINAPDYDAFFATLLPGDFYWSVTYSQIKILVDFGGYLDWQDLTVYAA